MKKSLKIFIVLILLLMSIFLLLNYKYNSYNTIRVATFNSLSMRDGVESIKKYVRTKKIDIIGFQEVDYIEEYQDIKVADIDYVESFPTGFGIKPNFGQMLYTRFNITDSEKFNMPDSTSEPRCVSRSVFNFNGKKISFYLTHLNASIQDTDRNNQKDYILNLMDNDPNQYKILVGDFNFKSKTDFDDFIRHGYKIANGKDGKWFKTYKGPDGTSWGNSALDNIIVSSNIDIVNVQMETSYLQKSDHNLLFADIIFTE
nr:endonuclease/exonuclease/phosphatase family protein [Clostridium paraputrificum]